MDNIEEFQYEALQPSEPSIRVVQILPGKSDDDIVQCSLREVPLQKTHTCLSYVCGDPSAERKIILVNGKQFSVLPNLWAFLHQARELGIEESLWIDAISINQNNIPERNRQVRQMSDIYQHAKHVIVWPGYVEWRRFSLTSEEAEREGFQLHDMPAGYVSLTEKPEAKRIIQDLALKKLFHDDHIREYFGRLWIVQEILLAARRSIILSGRMESWEDFANLMTIFWDQDAKWIKSDQLQQNPDVSLVTIRHTGRAGMEENVTLPRSLELLKLSVEPSRKPLTFLDLVTMSSDSACSEQRDHLYALLGLIEAGRDFPVDYNQPKEAILLDALEYFIPKSGVDFSRDFSQPYQFLNHLFEIQVGALCKLCALEGHPGHLNKDEGSEHDTFEISILDAKKRSLPAEFVMCPVESVACFATADERLHNIHDSIGYCQSCRKGVFEFSGGWPLVSIAFFRESPERLWITVSKAKQPIRRRINNRLQGIRDRLRLAFPAPSDGDKQVNVHLGKDVPNLVALYQAAEKRKSGVLSKGQVVLPAAKKKM